MELLLAPKGFTIFGLYVSFYGLMIAIGMAVGVIVAIYLCKVKKIDKEMPLNLALLALPLAIIGARLYFCLFNGVASFLDVFKIWEGGMAIYGGVIGGFLGIVISCLIHKYNLLDACDLAAPCLIIGQAIGRIGCIFAGCCYGVSATETWQMVFPISVNIGGTWHMATNLYESVLDLLLFVLLFVISHKKAKTGVVTGLYLAGYGVIRGVLEIFRDEAEALKILNTGLRVSQLLSYALIAVGIVLIILCTRKKEGKKNV